MLLIVSEEENSESSGNENDDDVVNESLYCPREEVEDNLPMSSFKVCHYYTKIFEQLFRNQWIFLAVSLR